MVRRIAGVVGVLALLVSAPVLAQEQNTTGQPQHQNTQTTLQQRLEPPPAQSLDLVPRVGLERKLTDLPAENTALQPMASSGQSIGLMIAGAALFVAGAIIEGDAGTFLMVGGAGIGAYGLYLHFR
jgi:hypothetical protein